jgi:hypothetical protein
MAVIRSIPGAHYTAAGAAAAVPTVVFRIGGSVSRQSAVLAACVLSILGMPLMGPITPSAARHSADVAGGKRKGGLEAALSRVCQIGPSITREYHGAEQAHFLIGENLALRQQIIVLQRTAPKRLRFNTFDRLIFVGLYRLFPDLRDALAVVSPETVIRWHRAGFRAYWRWRSRPRRGRPTVPIEIRQLIREMSLANPLWGAPRIHGELLKLGIAIGQTSVFKYMARRRGTQRAGMRSLDLQVLRR